MRSSSERGRRQEKMPENRGEQRERRIRKHKPEGGRRPKVQGEENKQLHASLEARAEPARRKGEGPTRRRRQTRRPTERDHGQKQESRRKGKRQQERLSREDRGETTNPPRGKDAGRRGPDESERKRNTRNSGKGTGDAHKRKKRREKARATERNSWEERTEGARGRRASAGRKRQPRGGPNAAFATQKKSAKVQKAARGAERCEGASKGRTRMQPSEPTATPVQKGRQEIQRETHHSRADGAQKRRRGGRGGDQREKQNKKNNEGTDSKRLKSPPKLGKESGQKMRKKSKDNQRERHATSGKKKSSAQDAHQANAAQAATEKEKANNGKEQERKRGARKKACKKQKPLTKGGGSQGSEKATKLN